jgi:hypothetical protein
MPIRNREELEAAAREAGRLLQEINDCAGEPWFTDRAAKVRFPWRFLKPAEHHRQKLRFVASPVLRSNLAYAVMTHDVLRWVVTRTTITGQAEEMLIKEAICLIGSMCESITVFPGEHGLGRNNRTFVQRVGSLRERGVIGDELHDELCWVWEVRKREHLVDVPRAEWREYDTAHWNRATDAWKALRRALYLWRFPNANNPEDAPF